MKMEALVVLIVGAVVVWIYWPRSRDPYDPG
jgi:hypothetical protein